MTHSNKTIFFLLAWVIGLTSCAQKHIDIYVNSFNRGDYCYILWTSDTTLSNPHSKIKLSFDSNGVVYIHRILQVDKNNIRILDEQSQDISGNMINTMGDIENNYLSFYCPTEEEIKDHPHYDQYYQNKFFMPNNGLHKWTIFDLEKLGYMVDKQK
ncbi:MAG TPA: hypothetical protein PLP23_07685 [Panacibacter sp.]|nr:hypothetical protein [Panacibacter sp.]